MKLSNLATVEKEDLPFIYSGLGSISHKGRKYLKNIAQSLVAIQKRPGTPLPDSVSRKIAGKPVNKLP
jgi:hypothetical protein